MGKGKTMKYLHAVLILISLSTLFSFESAFNEFTEFGETTGTDCGRYFYRLRDNYILSGTSKGFSIFQTELDGSLTLIDTINTRNFQALTYNDNYLAISHWLMTNIDVYNIEDIEDIHFSHTIETNYCVPDIHLLANNKIVANKLNDNSVLLDIESGELLNNYPEYSILTETFLNDGIVLVYELLSQHFKWVTIDEENQLTPIKAENRNITYAKSEDDNIYIATDNYLKMYETIFEEEAQDSILVNASTTGFDSRGIEILDSKLYFVDGDYNNSSQMKEPVLRIYDILDDQFQYFCQEYFLENWDNRDYFLFQKAISCNNYIYLNAEEEGIKGYQMIDDQLQLISQYGDIAYWEKSFLTRENKIYLNARKKDRECVIYDLTNGETPAIIENDFPYGEYHKFPYQSDYLYKKSYLDSQVEFYQLNSDNTSTLIGSISEEYGYLYDHFIPLMMDENYLVYQLYNYVFVGTFSNGEFVESYTFNLGSTSNQREYTAFMKGNCLYSMNESGNLIDIYQVNADSYSLVSTENSYTFGVNTTSQIVSFSDEYVCFKGGNYYYYLMTIDADNYAVTGVYRLGLEDKVLNNIDNYLFVSKVGLGANYRLLEIKEFNPDNEVQYNLLESILFPSTIRSVDLLQVDECHYNMLVTTMGSLFYYQCAITPNGDLEISPVTLNASNYPNPFNPETTICYDISKQGKVSVDIYNLKGQKVKSLLNEIQEAGQHKIIWQGDNEDGKQVSSGTYFYKVKSGGEEIVKKMLLMK